MTTDDTTLALSAGDGTLQLGSLPTGGYKQLVATARPVPEGQGMQGLTPDRDCLLGPRSYTPWVCRRRRHAMAAPSPVCAVALLATGSPG